MPFTAVTQRCLDDDLPRIPDRSGLRQKFEEMRSTAALGQERIESLTERPCFSLHLGRYRAATWHEEGFDVVWLLAAAIHRQDDRLNDAYAYFERLEDDRVLYPTDADRRAFLEQRAAAEALADTEALVQLRNEALARPDTGRYVVHTVRGLYAEMWAERIGNLGLLALRLRVRRESSGYMTDSEVGPLVGAVFSDAVEERNDPDAHPDFRYFEEYVE